MDHDAIKNAEEKVASVQAALDEAQRVLQAAEKAQLVAEQSTKMMRTVAIAAIAGLVVVTLLVKRSHRFA